MPVLMRRRPLLRATAIGTGAYLAGRLRQQTHLWRREQQRLADLGPSRADGPPPAS